jgi:hypothetical protein
MEGFKEFLKHLENGCSDQEIINLYLNSPSKVKEICIKSGKSIGEFYRIIRNHDFAPNRLKAHHHHVVNYYNSGLSFNQIAELTGYTPRNIRYIVGKLKVD